MMNPLEIASALESLVAAIRSGDGTEPPPPPPPPPPPVEVIPAGMVAVRPTGVHGAGKVRFWPETVVLTNAQGAESGDINYLSYLTRMTRTINPATGAKFCTPGQWGDAFFPAAGSDALTFQVRADRHMHRDDWWAQAELDEQARVKAAQGNPDFSGGRPAPPAPPAHPGTDVPIGNEP